MFASFLIKKFVKNYKDLQNEKVRTSYGLMTGIIGIITNLVLFVVKLLVGLATNSIAVTADAFNNLNDSASSLVTILGFKLSTIPADEDHPFGHGRIEYISALVVSFMIMFVGFQFIKTSYERIINPSATTFQLIPFILILLSILGKIWLSRFNSQVGKAINSSALKATSFDAFGDVVISSGLAISLLISLWTHFTIDGYLGAAVSLFILYSGYKLIKDTLNPLLGEAPDEELVKAIKDGVLSYDYISGVHDLVIHNYGPHRWMATIHAEVPANIDIVKIHEVIDQAEKEVSKNLKIILVIHMDPINVDDEEITATKEDTLKILSKFSLVKSMHDFRVVGRGNHKDIIFDVVVDSSKKLKCEDEIRLKHSICEEFQKLHKGYNCEITVDQDFTDL